jgi:putative transposase
MSALVNPNPGNVVVCDGRRWVVTKMVDADSVMARDQETGNECRLRIGDMSAPVDKAQPAPPVHDFTILDQSKRDEAERRMNAIETLLAITPWTTKDVKARASEIGVHWTTLYSWLRRYAREGRASALIPFEGKGGPGKSRLDDVQDRVIEQIISEHYLTPLRPNVVQTHLQLELLCRQRGVPCPSLPTLRRRVKQISVHVRDLKREGRAAARKHDAVVGKFPDGEYPLATVQIDHVLLDIMVVDSIRRGDSGRIWLTLAIDSFSRMIVGYFLTYEHPSALSAGQCVANAILHKQSLLERLGLGQCVWPCYGVPHAVHMDNAKEFHGESIATAFAEYRIEAHFRVLGKPHYGGYVERMARTLNTALHELPGTTKSNSKKRGEYASGANAIFTLDELEQVLVNIFMSYHLKVHQGIGQSPLDAWNQAVTNGVAGRLPAYPIKRTDAERVQRDFLPLWRRTIQRSGVEIDGLTYQNGLLAPYIGSEDPKTKKGLDFDFKRDPRDLRFILFKNPKTNEYDTIPESSNSLPPISAKQWHALQDEVKKRNKSAAVISHGMILDCLERQNAYVEEASRKTKGARRLGERQIQSRRKALTASLPSNVIQLPLASTSTPPEEDEPLDDGKTLKVFDVFEAPK